MKIPMGFIANVLMGTKEKHAKVRSNKDDTKDGSFTSLRRRRFREGVLRVSAGGAGVSLGENSLTYHLRYQNIDSQYIVGL